MELLSFPIRGNKLSMQVQAVDHLFHHKSEFQTIDIYETEVFGKLLLLDGHIQLTTFDELAYHESLVHIPLLNIQNARSALVIGGGDGGVLRELTKSKSIKRIDIVEIDQAVIDASLKYLPSLSAGAFQDKRVKLYVQDAFHFVKNKSNDYDLIVVDSTDTYEDENGTISEKLFTETFYRDCFKALKTSGVIVTQADNPIFCPYSLDQIWNQFQEVFPIVGSYMGLVPSFGGYSAFCYGSKEITLSSGWNFKAPPKHLRYLNYSTYNLAFNHHLMGSNPFTSTPEPAPPRKAGRPRSSNSSPTRRKSLTGSKTIRSRKNP